MRVLTCVSCRAAVNGSATFGAYRFEQLINKNIGGLNVNGQAMNFYWQQTPKVRGRPPALLLLSCTARPQAMALLTGIQTPYLPSGFRVECSNLGVHLMPLHPAKPYVHFAAHTH